jgi:hypothetical protein
MARAFQVMGAGFSSGQAIAMGGTINAAVSAAGPTQGTATILTAAVNLITTAAANSGVILPQGQPGDEFLIWNFGANPCYIYPPSTAKINQLAPNGGASLPINTGIQITQITTTQFVAVQSA